MGSIRLAFDGYMERRLPSVTTLDLTETQRLSICRKFGGSSLAYSSATQPDLLHFGDQNGYIAFARKMGHVFVLGDPVAAPEHRLALLRRFIEQSGDPCFVQIGVETARMLSALGFRVNRMGVETILPLTETMFAGTRNQSIRYSEKWLIQRGYQLSEVLEGDASAEEAIRISEEWRSARIVSRREMRFLNRPFLPVPGPDMRRFVLRDPEGRIAALLDFDPVYAEDRITGYTTAFKRKRHGTTPHAEIALTKFAADRFRSERIGFITLGLSPLAAIDQSGFGESTLWRILFDKAYHSRRVNDRIFNLQGQAAFKRRFHGEEVPCYMAFRSASPLRMLALLRLLKTL